MMADGVTTRSALVVGLDAEILAGFRPAMRQFGLALETQQLATEAARRLGEDRFNLVICRYPLPDMLMREFAASVWRNSGSSRDAAMLVLAMSEMRTEVRRAVSGGPYLVQSITERSPILCESVGHLLRVGRRRSMRLPITLGPDRGGSLRGRTVNISVAGVPVENEPLLPVRSRCAFRLTLSRPDAPISGTAEVVRHSHPGRERVKGIALRFLSFDPECHDRLLTGLET